MVKPLWDSPSFFKVMIGDFRTTMRIPPYFKKHLGENISKKSVLRSPRGGQLQVKVGQEDGYLFFQDGWETFVSDHGISFGDFLVFFYDGDLVFDVKIYGKSGCEKEEPLPTEEKKTETGTPSEKPTECLHVDQDKVSPTVSKKRKAAVLAKSSKLCFKVMRAAKPIESERAIKAACSFKTTHPYIVATCRNSHKTYMTIPTDLVRKYNLAGKKLLILRDPLGSSWPINVASWSDGRLCLTTRWSDFYQKNCLKEGDVCVFEFVQGGNAINVHIFRVEEYTAKLIPKSGKSIQSGKRLLSKDDKERVLEAANSFKTRHPKFVVLWRLCRLYHVPIPKNVVKELGLRSRRTRTILFDPCGRTWPVEITCRPYGRVDLGIGWCDFSKGNQLAVGDACVFEFLGGTDAIQVHIFRLGETNSSAANGIPEQTHDQDSEILPC